MSDSVKYVRLAKRLVRGIVADVGGSGWSIAGYDIKEVPEDGTLAARFVRKALADGRLEVASQAEFDLVQEENEASAEVVRDSDPERFKVLQEHQIQENAARASQALQEQREEVDPDEDGYEAQMARRAALLDEQDELGLNSDDPEEQMKPKARGAKKAAKGQKPKQAAATPSE